MRSQTFGIEMETTGIGRERTAKAIAAYWAARAAAQAARVLGDERTADYTDEVADDLVTLAESAGHVIRR